MCAQPGRRIFHGMLPLRVPTLLVVLLTACGATEPGGAGALFTVSACEGETFRVLVTDSGVAAEMESRIGQGPGRIVLGRPARGDGGFNQPWSWHLAPATVELADLAVEVCDGCPSYVEGHLDDYLAVGSYCPWSSAVVARIR